MHIGLNIPFQKLRAAGGIPKVFYHYSIVIDEVDYFKSFVEQNSAVLLSNFPKQFLILPPPKKN